MLIKIKDVMLLNRGLIGISKRELPAKVAFRFARLQSKIENELHAVEEQRIKLIKKYGQENPQAQEINVLPENQLKFEQEYMEMLRESVEIEVVKLNIDELGDMKITAGELKDLGMIFN